MKPNQITEATQQSFFLHEMFDYKTPLIPQIMNEKEIVEMNELGSTKLQ